MIIIGSSTNILWHFWQTIIKRYNTEKSCSNWFSNRNHIKSYKELAQDVLQSKVPKNLLVVIDNASMNIIILLSDYIVRSSQASIICKHYSVVSSSVYLQRNNKAQLICKQKQLSRSLLGVLPVYLLYSTVFISLVFVEFPKAAMDLRNLIKTKHVLPKY